MLKNTHQTPQLPQTAVKCRFFAQYLFQNVFFGYTKVQMDLHPHHCELNYINKSQEYLEDATNSTPYLDLKDILKISNEDALQAVDLLGNSNHLSEESRIFQFKELFESPNFWVNQTNISLVKMLKVFDFLRSKGYALPFMEYSVDDLVSFGWVQLV